MYCWISHLCFKSLFISILCPLWGSSLTIMVLSTKITQITVIAFHFNFMVHQQISNTFKTNSQRIIARDDKKCWPPLPRKERNPSLLSDKLNDPIMHNMYYHLYRLNINSRCSNWFGKRLWNKETDRQWKIKENLFQQLRGSDVTGHQLRSCLLIGSSIFPSCSGSSPSVSAHGLTFRLTLGEASWTHVICTQTQKSSYYSKTWCKIEKAAKVESTTQTKPHLHKGTWKIRWYH